MQKISHVIFDFDGVILDTEVIFYDTNIQTMQHFGSKYTIDHKLGQMGRQQDEGTEWLLKTTGLFERGVTVDVLFLFILKLHLKYNFLAIYFCI